MIEIRELSFKYKGGSDYSLKDINLIIKKGECILLCGKSGCGKSTLLKLMNGIIPVSYTHLDVYKRQIYNDYIIKGENKTNSSEAFGIISELFQRPH